ncbi:hypothetical protein IWZ00DRAFT_533143 [Phyllosticta capitalensis]|uniref:F-box domain-containing protein n=1 Tax=Phyllosticta capitalensis TaxID=121624 RepID=A0ABR1YH12_9PEZI
MSSTRILPRLESLSEKIVNSVADYLDNDHLMNFRATSKTICKYLNSNTKLRKCFEDLECTFESAELWNLQTFMKTPLASAVKNLKFFKTDEMNNLNRKAPKLSIKPGTTVQFGSDEFNSLTSQLDAIQQYYHDRPEEDFKGPPQDLFAELINDGLPNLALVDFLHGKHLELAQAGSLRNPKPEDFKWVAEALGNIDRTLNFRMSYEQGALCFPWTVNRNGSVRGTHELWFEGYSNELPHPVTGTWERNTREDPTYFTPCLPDTIPILGSHALRTLSLHRCAFSLSDLRRLSDAKGQIEILVMTQSEVYSCYAGEEGQEEEHRFFTDPNSHLKKTLRSFGMSTCFTPSVPWVRVFKAMRKYSQLEKVIFENTCLGAQTVRFDWDGNGRYDNGSRLPAITQQLGMKGSLSKMIKRYEETTETSHLKLGVCHGSPIFS